jgi:hypothetical protein
MRAIANMFSYREKVLFSAKSFVMSLFIVHFFFPFLVVVSSLFLKSTISAFSSHDLCKYEYYNHEGGAWDESKLREFFYEADVQDILKIHVGRAGMEDFIAWNHTKSGIFSVKSAYHLAVQRKKSRKGGQESSRSCDQQKGWLAMWGTNVPGKVKVHFWQ